MILDSNILIGYLNGDSDLVTTLSAWKHQGRPLSISSISVAEVLALPGLTAVEIHSIRAFLKTFASIPFDDRIAEMAAETDVAISGVGHCGSSSPWSVIDAVNLEKAGVPTVALISRSFCPLGQIVARGEGHHGLPIVMLPHPIGEADRVKIVQKGVDAAAECVRLLTTPGETVGAEYAAKKFPLPEHAVPRG